MQSTGSRSFGHDLLQACKDLRVFAISLSRNATRGDDLVQETMLKAWANRNSFKPGTNLHAWLFTILRNEFYSQARKRSRESEDPDEKLQGELIEHERQSAFMDLQDTRMAIDRLPGELQEAIVLVGAGGLTYEDAARECGVALGTIKSRVSRARARLKNELDRPSP
jgi:RNA polymerase sigma-70 factor, ECF subfamily